MKNAKRDTLPLDDLIDYVKPYLKSKGFKKKNRRWTKDIGDFTLCFYIQESSFSKDLYYVRPGIFINALPTKRTYGHWMTEISQTTPEEIIEKFEKWCGEWTDKSLIRKRLVAFLEWEKRNPLEKRRAKLVDYDSDPVPAWEYFQVLDPLPSEHNVIHYILENF